MKKEVYILGKISDYTPKRWARNCARFNDKEKELQTLGFKTFNPARQNPQGKSWEWYMARSVKLMIEKRPICYFLKNWEKSRGGRMEMELAKYLGLKIHIEK
jgi:hypothetical protein